MDEMVSCLEFALKITLVVTACWGYELVIVETIRVTEKILLFCLLLSIFKPFDDTAPHPSLLALKAKAIFFLYKFFFFK